MIFGKLWERYLFSEILKAFLFFVFSFQLLYTLIDYSIHASQFSKIENLQWIDLSTYYFYIFIKRIDLILPLALLIATNKVLLHLNLKNEMMALFVGGLRKIDLLRPFFIMAFLITISILLSFQYLIPNSLDYLEQFENAHLKKNSSINYKIPSTYTLPVDPEGKLIFSKYDAISKCFEDVFYIKSQDEMWKIKLLKTEKPTPEGLYVDHLVRDKDDLLIKKESYDNLLFPDLTIDFSSKNKALVPFEHRSISSLCSMMIEPITATQEKSSKIQTHLFFKLCMPFISFLVIIACAPFCMNFSRSLPIFMIYAMSVFGIIAFFTTMDAAVILGENHLFPPFLAIALPFLLGFGGFGVKFIKNCLK